MRNRTAAVASFVLVWLLAVVLPGLRAPDHLFPAGIASLHGSRAGDVLASAVGVAIVAAAAGFLYLVARLILRGRRRRRDQRRYEHVSMVPRARAREVVLLLVFLAIVVLAGRILWARLSMAGEPSQAAPPPASTLPKAENPRPADGSANPGPRRELPLWALLAGCAALAVLIGGSAWLIARSRAEPGHDPIRRDAELADDGRGIQVTEAEAVSEPVLACYREMCISFLGILPDQRSLTPWELVRQVRDRGLVDGNVEVLTRLFERVRYGHEPSSALQRRQAIAALQIIRSRLAGNEPA